MSRVGSDQEVSNHTHTHTPYMPAMNTTLPPLLLQERLPSASCLHIFKTFRPFWDQGGEVCAGYVGEALWRGSVKLWNQAPSFQASVSSLMRLPCEHIHAEHLSTVGVHLGLPGLALLAHGIHHPHSPWGISLMERGPEVQTWYIIMMHP